MLVVAKLFGGRVYSPTQLKDVVGSEITNDAMVDALDTVRAAFAKFQAKHGGQIDKIAKGSAFTEALLADRSS
jgi:hypothetical protein